MGQGFPDPGQCSLTGAEGEPVKLGEFFVFILFKP